MPNTFEEWWYFLMDSAPVNFPSFKTVVSWALFLYITVFVIFDFKINIQDHIKPTVSSRTRRLLEERGQAGLSPEQFVSACESEWKNLHASLNLLDSIASAKIVNRKLQLKLSLINSFKD
jgi:hypothetical protein